MGSYACACSRPASASVDAEPSLDDTLDHSFCYASSTAAHCSFRHGIFGAALSANSSVPVPLYQSSVVAVGAMPPNYSSAFHTSSSFSFALLRLSNLSSEPLFLFGPIYCGAQLSSPLDPFSDPLPTKPAPSSIRHQEGSRGGYGSHRSAACGGACQRRTGRSWYRSAATKACSERTAAWGEDRVHVVVSEDQRWLFVGIYDGFNGPEAPDFLVANLCRFLLRELRGIFYEEVDVDTKRLWQFHTDGGDDDSEFDFSGSGRFAVSLARLKERQFPMWADAAATGNDESGRDWGARRLAVASAVKDHGIVLTNQSMGSHPELAVTGACLLMALVRDDNVYVTSMGTAKLLCEQGPS